MSQIAPALLAGAFGGGRTIGLSARPGGFKVGRFDPTIPSLNYLSARYGLSDRTAPSPEHPDGEEMTTGPIAGPEGQGRGALGLLQLAIDSQTKTKLFLPGIMPSTAIATEQDAVDATFIAVGGTNYWSAFVAPILALVQSGPPVVTPPGLGGGKTPTAPPAAVATSKLSPASVRVEELRVSAALIVPISWLDFRVGSSEWLGVKPFAVEALKFYREIRDAVRQRTGLPLREIPQEDR